MRLINIFQSQAKISTSNWSQFYQILEVMWKVEINYFCIYEPNYEKGLQLQINPLHNTWNVNCKGYETIFAKTCLVQTLFKRSSLHKALIDGFFGIQFWKSPSTYSKCFIELGMKIRFLTFEIEFQKSGFQPSSIYSYIVYKAHLSFTLRIKNYVVAH